MNDVGLESKGKLRAKLTAVDSRLVAVGKCKDYVK
ncbi:hypothetical protein CfE428DRAFT_3926 [Chthoniobacter flavus Ellin428]|uniref:Uncharacterized protein n=1 Tax=Chthoniobacter flavus Ellin428 TaxID=497964 RepID=B4D4T8_9BACT|nr:hypothetical protein CfE428DRAFT_3926 [Chthoniobacter flavus Ellin428]TCO91003.1 hypothetical protein EV701_109153 [Chthoniobacter flavus]